jgi:hypothetical protein
MILTPIEPTRLAAVLRRFAAALPARARPAFDRIADPRKAHRATGAEAARHHRIAIDLARSFGMEILPGSPALDLGWNGRALRSATEAYVLIHEIAHFQIAPPGRRALIDFGLGPGPESGDREAAERAACVSGLAREAEEAMASLLGVLWEVELAQPGLASFLDQNWLEGAERPSAAAHFDRVLEQLRARRVVDRDGRPQRRCVTGPETDQALRAASSEAEVIQRPASATS